MMMHIKAYNICFRATIDDDLKCFKDFALYTVIQISETSIS